MNSSGYQRFFTGRATAITIALTLPWLLFKAGQADPIVPAPLSTPEAAASGVENVDTTGARPGDVAPAFVLPAVHGRFFNSRDLLGQHPLLLLLDKSNPALDLSQQVADAAAAGSRESGSVVAVASANPATATTWVAPTPLVTVRDEASQLALGVSRPALCAIDRAGFWREIDSLPSLAADPHQIRLQFLLRTLPDPTPDLREGAPAPDFSFRDSDGVWRRVSDLRGHENLMLTFFPKCFTGGCRTHLSSLRDSFSGFIASHTQVWAVSADPAAGEHGQRAFSASLGLPFPLLPDTGRNVSLLYGAVQKLDDLDLRQSVLIDKNGIVRLIDRNVSPASHGEEMLARISALGLDR